MALIENLLGMSRDFFVLWGYIVVFLTIFLESLPFIGAFIPGGFITLLLSGFLAKLEFFVLWKIILVAIIASILIDTFGYLLGRFVDRDFFRQHSRILLVKRKTIEKVIRVVHENIGKSLIVGRINPITRSIAPFVVGNERVGFVKFLFYNFLGGVLWVTTFICIGYLFGNSFQVIQDIEKYVWWTIIVLVVGFYICYLGESFKKFFGKDRVNNGTNRKK